MTPKNANGCEMYDYLTEMINTTSGRGEAERLLWFEKSFYQWG